MLITLEMAKESPIGTKMLNNNLDLLSPKHCYLSAFLLQEKCKENSKFQPYLDILPKDYTNFPIFFTPFEKDLLIGSPFLHLISEKISDIETDYKLILNVAPEFEKFSIKEFSEMRMAVSSRIFGIKVNGKKTDVFAPLADMLNHKRPRQTQWFYSDDLKSFVVQALQDVEKGDQIFDSYGKKCNSRFLLNYGFIVRENDGNEFNVSVELGENYPQSLFKINLMLPSKDLKRNFKLLMSLNEQVVLDFIGYLRYCNFDEDKNILINVI
jgi:histone-lysine N-methyltransferase SETD3